MLSGLLIKQDALLWLVGFFLRLSSSRLVHWCYWVVPSAVRCRAAFFFFFFIVGHPRLKNFYSTVPVGVVRVTSYVNCLFDPVSVPVRITINKLNLILKRLCCGRALKRRRSEHGLFRCIGRTPSFCLALVFQSRWCKLGCIHREFCKLRRSV